LVCDPSFAWSAKAGFCRVFKLTYGLLRNPLIRENVLTSEVRNGVIRGI
jgi:hypothetical protein